VEERSVVPLALASAAKHHQAREIPEMEGQAAMGWEDVAGLAGSLESDTGHDTG